MKNKKRILTLVTVLALSAALLVGCGAPKQAAVEPHNHEHESVVEMLLNQSSGGVLCLKINPEIALHYDESGKVTKLEARNDDGAQILVGFTGYEGKETSVVLQELVNLIGKAGYFVEEAEGEARKIVLELDPGSDVPHENFLQDMADHVKLCIQNKEWVGEIDYEYDEPTVPTEATQPTTAPTEAAKTGNNNTGNSKNTGKSTTETTIPDGLCPVCADDDCNDGKYCDDADEREENLREYERLMSGDVCPVCADPDCDDGKYCDDADEKAENEKENAAKKEKTSSTKKKTSTSTKKDTSSSKKSTTSTKKDTSSSKVPAGLCPICADDDCDDGKYCDDADEKDENLREYEAEQKAKKKASSTKVPAGLCPVCGDDDCDDGKYCDDYDDLEENLREYEAKKAKAEAKEKAEEEAKKKAEAEAKEKAEEEAKKKAEAEAKEKAEEEAKKKAEAEAKAKAEAEAKAKAEAQKDVCPICGENDCDDGDQCDGD